MSSPKLFFHLTWRPRQQRAYHLLRRRRLPCHAPARPCCCTALLAARWEAMLQACGCTGRPPGASLLDSASPAPPAEQLCAPVTDRPLLCRASSPRAQRGLVLHHPVLCRLGLLHLPVLRWSPSAPLGARTRAGHGRIQGRESSSACTRSTPPCSRRRPRPSTSPSWALVVYHNYDTRFPKKNF